MRIHPDNPSVPVDNSSWILFLVGGIFTLIGGGADTPDLLSWQIASGVVFTSGTVTGIPVTEDELIRDALLKERVSYGG
jgi:hypothetical protein